MIETIGYGRSIHMVERYVMSNRLPPLSLPVLTTKVDISGEFMTVYGFRINTTIKYAVLADPPDVDAGIR